MPCPSHPNAFHIFVIIEGSMSGTYLGFEIIAFQTQHMGSASLLNEVSGNSISVIDFTHCINKAILFLGNNVDRISEEGLNSVGGPIKISGDRPSVNMYFPV
jgi:hypothetical protein